MDDLLDLNWSSSSANTPVSAQKQPSKPSYNAFDSLAAATSSQPAGTNYYSRALPSRSNSALDNSDNISKRPVSPAAPASIASQSDGNDAFSALFQDAAQGITRGGAEHKESKLSMAQRLELQQNNSMTSS